MSRSKGKTPAQEVTGGERRGEDDPGKIVAVPTPENNPPEQSGWRDRLPIHPAAEILPLMGEHELRELADDIKQHGLQEPVALYSVKNTKSYCLLDGRNRLDALELNGVELFRDGWSNKHFRRYVKQGLIVLADLDEAIAYVFSRNIRRRHLTQDQKRKLAGKLLELNPGQSDRQIGAAVRVDHKTVAKERRKKVARGEIPHVAKRADTKGRKQPSTRTIRVKVTHSTRQIAAPYHLSPVADPPKATNADYLSKAAADSAKALREFIYACGQYLPRMNDAHRQEAISRCATFANRVARSSETPQLQTPEAVQ